MVDYSGKITRYKRDTVLELAIQKLICNATATKFTDKDTGKTTISLRGVGIELKQLPYLVVDANGKIVDPTKSVGTTVRGAYMKRNGVIRDLCTNKVITFRAGDYIICNANGTINVLDRLDVEKEYDIDRNSKSALCDDYISDDKYNIEVFGTKPIKLTSIMIKSWAILKSKSTVKA